MTGFNEAEVEKIALEYLANLGWATVYGPDMAPFTAGAEREKYDQAVLAARLRDALARLNRELPPEALESASRKLTRAEGATLETRNRAFHRMLVDGVNVEYR